MVYLKLLVAQRLCCKNKEKQQQRRNSDKLFAQHLGLGEILIIWPASNPAFAVDEGMCPPYRFVLWSVMLCIYGAFAYSRNTGYILLATDKHQKIVSDKRHKDESSSSFSFFNASSIQLISPLTRIRVNNCVLSHNRIGMSNSSQIDTYTHNT